MTERHHAKILLVQSMPLNPCHQKIIQRKKEKPRECFAWPTFDPVPVKAKRNADIKLPPQRLKKMLLLCNYALGRRTLL
jgi:hypothetical protein